MKKATRNSIRAIGISLLAFCSLALSAAQAQDRRVIISNQSSVTLVRFYASNVSRGRWEEDILGFRVLDSGDYVTADIDDGTGHCRFDFKAVFSNGNEITRRNVNVCTTASWTIYDRSNDLN